MKSEHTVANDITDALLDYFARFLWPNAAEGERLEHRRRADVLPEHTWITAFYEDARRVAAGHEPVVYLREDITGDLLRQAHTIVNDYYLADDALEEILDDADGPVTEGVAVNRAIGLARAGAYPVVNYRPTADPISHALNRALCKLRGERAQRNRKELERRVAEHAPHERAVLLASRERLESVLLDIAGVVEAEEWDASAIEDVYRHLHRAGFAPPLAPPGGYDGTYVEEHCPECEQSESECICGDGAAERSTLTIRVTIDGAGDADARQVVNEVLDGGALQEAIEDYPRDEGALRVVAVAVEDPDTVDETGLGGEQ